jgi:hypothetical protein
VFGDVSAAVSSHQFRDRIEPGGMMDARIVSAKTRFALCPGMTFSGRSG